MHAKSAIPKTKLSVLYGFLPPLEQSELVIASNYLSLP